jgi:LL-diaminopimelate aminotransferase
MMKIARRIEGLKSYLFVEINKKIAERRARGEDIVSFAIGDPDMPTPPHVIKKLCEAAQDPANHRYPESAGLPELHKAIADWYKKRFDVNLDPETEVLPLIGSKEGIAHIAFCFIDPGDTALITDPAYPVYSIGTQLAGGRPYYLALKAEHKFLPNLNNIPDFVLKKTKILWINYPNNPTGATAEPDFFNQVVEFAKKNDILVCHDGPYSEVSFDNYQPTSFMQAAGAKDIGVEFHSFSKSYNMTGWRIGMVVGNAAAITALRTLKSNLDSGIPKAIQYMAIEALQGPQDSIPEHNNTYQRRRDLICEVLSRIGLEVVPPKASLYVWAKVPEGYNSMDFTGDLMDQVGVAVTPGLEYGRSGEGYVRLSLTIPDASLVKGLSRLSGWRNTRHLTLKKIV